MGAALSGARIETDSAEFFPGQMVRGTVCAELDSEVDFRAIELEAAGQEVTCFEQSDLERALSHVLYFAAVCMSPSQSANSGGGGGVVLPAGPSTTFSAQRTITLHRQSLRESGRLLPGPVRLPFSFQLPYDVPCSATLSETGYSAAIAYRITATLLHDGLHHNTPSTSCVLTVVAPAPGSTRPEAAKEAAPPPPHSPPQRSSAGGGGDVRRTSSSGGGGSGSGGRDEEGREGGRFDHPASGLSHPPPPPSLDTGCTADVTFLTASQGRMTLKVHSPSCVVAAGQALHLSMKVSNQSSVAVQGMTAVLTEHVTLVGQEGGEAERRQVERSFTRTLAEHHLAQVIPAAAKINGSSSSSSSQGGAGSCVAAAAEVTLSCSLLVPPHYGPAILGQLVRSRHELIVTLETEPLCSHVSATAEVHIARSS